MAVNDTESLNQNYTLSEFDYAQNSKSNIKSTNVTDISIIEKTCLSNAIPRNRFNYYLNSVAKNSQPSINSSGDSVKDFTPVPIKLSARLQQYLIHDYKIINHKRRLTKVPAQQNIISILENFVRKYACAKMLLYEKQLSKTPSTSNRLLEDRIRFEKSIHAINIVKEVAEGVRILLDFNLDTLLLYSQSGEQEQYDRCVKNSDYSNQEGVLSTHSRVSLKTKEVFSQDKHDQMKENINIQILNSNFETSTNTSSILATTALRERRKISLSVDSKASSLIETDNCGSKLSLQSGGCSSKESTISGRSSATPTQSLLTPPATSPTTPQATQLMRSLHEWKLVPHIDTEGIFQSGQGSMSEDRNQRQNIDILPSCIYGPIHLLRLFVKMPEILGRMKIPQKRSKIIVKYVDSLIKYLESQPDLFNTNSIYE